MRAWRTLALASLLLLPALEALARLGGGESYGGGSRGGGGHGGGGGGGDGGFLVDLLLWLLIRNPKVGLPVLAIVVVVVLVRHGMRSKYRAGSVVAGSDRAVTSRRTDLFGPLRARDPSFSEPLFLDLVQLVYVRAAEARTAGAFDHLRTYLSSRVVERFTADGRCEVRNVLIGSSRVAAVSVGARHARITVDFETNLTEVRDGRPTQLLSRERWVFQRDADTLSPGPDQMQALRCPSCGAAAETRPDGTCVHCSTPVADARLQWQVADVQVLERRPVRALELTPGGGEEVGTELPTVLDPDLPAASRALLARRPDFTWEGFTSWVRQVFGKMQSAWADQAEERLRPYETDHLFQSHRFWIEQYRRSGLRNHLEDIEVERIVPVKVSMDAYYEAVTVRVQAKMRDFTLDKAGNVVSGTRRFKRRFSEYWTFVRASGAAKTKDPLDAEHCPSCGAALDRVSEGGVCGYCETKITAGEHSWVLSAIAQDEAYEG